MGDTVIDEVGNRYGRLLVLEREQSTKGDKKAHWLCRCDCGKETVVRGTHLRLGKIKSCGCLRKEMGRTAGLSLRLPKGMGAMGQIFCQYRWSAKQRGYEWRLSKMEFHALTQSPCYYCGIGPGRGSNADRYHGKYIRNGLDRMNNKRGYSIDNVVPCCPKCNRAKDIMGIEEFASWIIRIYNHLIIEKEVVT